MATSKYHDQAPLGEIHKVHNWEYSSSATRLAAVGFAAGDIYKFALQLDDKSLWLLTNTSPPAWKAVSLPTLNNRGMYDASSNLFPATGGSGLAGAVKGDDLWYISVAGTLGGTAVVAGDAVVAITDAPLQVAASWRITSNNTDIYSATTVIRDSDNGIVGRTAGKNNFLNIARTFKSFLRNTNAASRTYDFPDVNGSILVQAATQVVASATSTPIGAALVQNVDISLGASPVTSFDNVAEGIVRYGRILGVITFTASTNLITPDGGNITSSAGDTYMAKSLGAGVWQILQYHRLHAGEVRPGVILDFAGITVPDGYYSCNGANASRSTDATLFAAIGTTWGAGDGFSTFTLPDLRRRVLVGTGGSNTSGYLGTAVGSYGGEETHVLSWVEMPVHTHNLQIRAYVGAPLGVASSDSGASGNMNTDSAGSGAAHNNIQLAAVSYKIIKR